MRVTYLSVSAVGGERAAEGGKAQHQPKLGGAAPRLREGGGEGGKVADQDLWLELGGVGRRGGRRLEKPKLWQKLPSERASETRGFFAKKEGVFYGTRLATA